MKKQARILKCGNCKSEMGTVEDIEQTEEGWFRECPICKWVMMYNYCEPQKLITGITCKETKSKCLETLRGLQSIMIPVTKMAHRF